mmetsp:Transcript_40081/g.65725  ORF Transcript_40081/g.65725 Transcript_40081/m.65725 type:complete len:297 (+) Transcript_40081:416-1306(+)
MCRLVILVAAHGPLELVHHFSRQLTPRKHIAQHTATATTTIAIANASSTTTNTCASTIIIVVIIIATAAAMMWFMLEQFLFRSAHIRRLFVANTRQSTRTNTRQNTSDGRRHILRRIHQLATACHRVHGRTRQCRQQVWIEIVRFAISSAIVCRRRVVVVATTFLHARFVDACIVRVHVRIIQQIETAAFRGFRCRRLVFWLFLAVTGSTFLWRRRTFGCTTRSFATCCRTFFGAFRFHHNFVGDTRRNIVIQRISAFTFVQHTKCSLVMILGHFINAKINRALSFLQLYILRQNL